jgi:hypothetical protein
MSDMLGAAREEHSVSPALRHERLTPERCRSSFQRLANGYILAGTLPLVFWEALPPHDSENSEQGTV